MGSPDQLSGSPTPAPTRSSALPITTGGRPTTSAPGEEKGAAPVAPLPALRRPRHRALPQRLPARSSGIRPERIRDSRPRPRRARGARQRRRPRAAPAARRSISPPMTQGREYLVLRYDPGMAELAPLNRLWAHPRRDRAQGHPRRRRSPRRANPVDPGRHPVDPAPGRNRIAARSPLVRRSACRRASRVAVTDHTPRGGRSSGGQAMPSRATGESVRARGLYRHRGAAHPLPLLAPRGGAARGRRDLPRGELARRPARLDRRAARRRRASPSMPSTCAAAASRRASGSTSTMSPSTSPTSAG